jgi:CRISPR-associated protein Csb1
MAFTESAPNRATGMYRHCPTALIFGLWDSTGPKGGLGAKFQRCLTSEIVGIDAVTGIKTKSRIDPLQIEKAGTVFKSASDALDWTLDGKEAEKDKKDQPVRAGKKGEGNPSGINHGNIPPGIDLESGGVTIAHATHTVVLSLAGLRRLRFPTKVDGTKISDADRPQAETAARTLLASLALAAVAFQRDAGYDLRSRCVLVATEPLAFTLMNNDGSSPPPFTVDRKSAAKLVADAHEEARKWGLGWERGPVSLKPAPKLVQLIKQSRDLMRVEGADAGA